MAPEITNISFEQVDGRPGVHLVGEVERWRVQIYPKSITSAMLDPSSKWGFSGDLLSQAADLSEAEVRWTEPGEQWVMGWFSRPGPGHSAWSVFAKVMVRHTRPTPTPVPTVPALVDPLGFPEIIPDRAFVSTVGDQDAERFLNEAVEFHREWEVPVTRVGSFQEILEGVASMGSATTLRIVSHALRFQLDGDTLVGLLELPMFRGAEFPRLDYIETPVAGPSPTRLPPDRLLTALAESEVALVETLLGYPLPADFVIPNSGGQALADLVVGLVRAHVNGGAALIPFGLQASGQPRGFVRELVGRAVELTALKKSDQAGPGIKDQYDAVDFILDARHEGSLRQRVAAEAGVSNDAVKMLERAIGTRVVVGAGQAVDKLTIRPGSLNSPNAGALANAVRALRTRGRQSIRSLIQRSRRVFRTPDGAGGPGRIDVRGCEIVGKRHGRPLLGAIRQIFDPGEASEISGTSMFQSYPRIDLRVATDVGLDALAQNGAPEISDEFDHWAFISGAIRRIGGILQWNSQSFPARGIGLLDMGVPVPILDRSVSPDPAAVMFALGNSISQAGLTRVVARRLLAAMWVNKDGSRPDVLIDRNLDRWAAGQPPRTAILTEMFLPDAFSANRIYFQGDARFAIDGIEILPPVSRGQIRHELRTL